MSILADALQLAGMNQEGPQAPSASEEPTFGPLLSDAMAMAPDKPGAFWSGVERGLAAIPSGLGELLGSATWTEIGQGMKARVPAGTGLREAIDDPSKIPAFVGTAIGEGIGMTAPSLVLAPKSFFGAAALFYPSAFGEVRERQFQEGDEQYEGAGQYMKATAAALVNSLIEMGFGPQRILRNLDQLGETPIRTFGKDILQSMLGEGGEEAVQTIPTRLAAGLPINNLETLQEMGEGAVTGAVGGLGVGGYVGGVRALGQWAQPEQPVEPPPPGPIPRIAPTAPGIEGELMPFAPQPATGPFIGQQPMGLLPAPAIEGQATAEPQAQSTEGMPGDWQAAWRGVRDLLDSVGLSDIGIRLEERISGEDANAYFDPLAKVVGLAMDTAPEERTGAVNHEIVHALKSLGVFTDKEWSVLSRSAQAWARKGGKGLMDQYSARGVQGEALIEEAIAELYREHVEGRLKPSAGLGQILSKIRQFLEAIGNGFRFGQFQSSAGVMEAIRQGRIGARERGGQLAEEGIGPRWQMRDTETWYHGSGQAFGRPQFPIWLAQREGAATYAQQTRTPNLHRFDINPARIMSLEQVEAVGKQLGMSESELEEAIFGRSMRTKELHSAIQQAGFSGFRAFDQRADTGDVMDSVVVLDEGALADRKFQLRPGEGLAPIDERFRSNLRAAFAGAKQSKMPASEWLRWLQANAGKLGVKEDEIGWTGLRPWLGGLGKESVTKDQLLSFIDQNSPKFERISGQYQGTSVRAGRTAPPIGRSAGVAQESVEEPGGAYVHAGLKNLGAMTLSYLHPNIKVKSHYFSVGNQMFWIRFGELENSPDGKRTLWIDEIQSDWAQGDKPFVDIRPETWRAVRVDADYWAILGQAGEDIMRIPDVAVVQEVSDAVIPGLHVDDIANATQEQVNKWMETGAKRVALRQLQISIQNRDYRPAGPLVTKTELWVGRALREIIGMAVDGGFERVMFVNGQEIVKDRMAPSGNLEFYDKILPRLLKDELKPFGVEVQSYGDVAPARIGLSVQAAMHEYRNQVYSWALQQRISNAFDALEPGNVWDVYNNATLEQLRQPWRLAMDGTILAIERLERSMDRSTFVYSASDKSELKKGALEAAIGTLGNLESNYDVPSADRMTRYDVFDGFALTAPTEEILTFVRQLEQSIDYLLGSYFDLSFVYQPKPNVGFDVTPALASKVQENGLRKFQLRRNQAGLASTNPAAIRGTLNRLFNSINVKGMNTKKIAQGLATFNKGLKWMATLPQLERENWGVHGMRQFVDAMRGFWAEKSNWVEQWDKWLEHAQTLDKEDQQQLWEFGLNVTLLSDELKRKLTPAEIAIEANRVGGLSVEQMEVWRRGRELLDSAFTANHQVIELSIKRQFAHDAIVQASELAKLQAEFQTMMNRDYWPISRFGKYALYVRVAQGKTVRYGGKVYQSGETVLFNLFETEKEQQKEKWRLQQHFGTGRTNSPVVEIAADVVDESLYSFMGMPPSLLRHLEKEMMEKITTEMGFDPAADTRLKRALHEQLKALRMAMVELSPAQAHMHRMLKRQGIPGFSMNGLRSMAYWGRSFSNHIARAKWKTPMDDALDIMDGHKQDISRTTDPALFEQGNVVGELLNHLREHQWVVTNPGNDWANLRALGFMWYLGFVPRAAVVQPFQLITTAGPWLAARFGDAATLAQMGRSVAQIRTLFSKPQRINLRLDEQQALDAATKAGYINEGQFTELAGVAEGSNLQRILPGTFLKSDKAARQIRKWGYYSSYLFQQMEVFNRLITFHAAYNLSVRKALDELGLGGQPIASALAQLPASEMELLRKRAIEVGRNAVETSQLEYARWARPRFAWGKRSALFLFKLYQQGMLFFMARDPGKWRFIAAQLTLAGAMGLPFAADLLALINALGLGGDSGDAEDELREVLTGLEVDPDLILHGTARYGFGTGYDLSSSLSLGNMVPAWEPIMQSFMPQGSAKDSALRAGQEAIGALFSIPIKIWQAMASGQERDWEQASPTILRDAYRAYRRVRDEGEIARDGTQITQMDMSKWDHWLDTFAQAAGFRTTELAMKTDMSWAQKSAQRYWTAKRTVISQQYFVLRHSGWKDREAIADWMDAYRQFNSEVPWPEMKLNKQALDKGAKQRETNLRKREAGQPAGKAYRRMFQEIEEGYPAAATSD